MYRGTHRSPNRPLRPSIPTTAWVTTGCTALAAAALLAVPQPSAYHPTTPSVSNTLQQGPDVSANDMDPDKGDPQVTTLDMQGPDGTWHLDCRVIVAEPASHLVCPDGYKEDS